MNQAAGRAYTQLRIFDVKLFFVIDIRLSSQLSFSQEDYQVLFAEEMREKLREMNVEFVDQAKLICPEGVCYPMTDGGKPIYKDSGHMRPFFVKEHMDVLDAYFRRLN